VLTLIYQGIWLVLIGYLVVEVCGDRWWKVGVCGKLEILKSLLIPRFARVC